MDFDALDHAIMRELRTNARTDASKIAERVGANERTVRKRLERLLSTGAIRLSAVMNPRAFGYGTIVDVFVKMDPELEEEIVKVLLDRPEVSYLAYGQGTCDLLVQACFKNNHEMRTFVRRFVPSLRGVTVMDHVLVAEVLRDSDDWVPAQDLPRETADAKAS